MGDIFNYRPYKYSIQKNKLRFSLLKRIFNDKYKILLCDILVKITLLCAYNFKLSEKGVRFI